MRRLRVIDSESKGFFCGSVIPDGGNLSQRSAFQHYTVVRIVLRSLECEMIGIAGMVTGMMKRLNV